MEQDRLSDIECKAMQIIAQATRNQTPEPILFWQLYALAMDCLRRGNEDDHQAVMKIIGFLLRL